MGNSLHQLNWVASSWTCLFPHRKIIPDFIVLLKSSWLGLWYLNVLSFFLNLLDKSVCNIFLIPHWLVCLAVLNALYVVINHFLLKASLSITFLPLDTPNHPMFAYSVLNILTLASNARFFCCLLILKHWHYKLYLLS